MLYTLTFRRIFMFENSQFQVFSSFEKNGKKYLILELEEFHNLFQADFEIKVERNDDQICLILYYKNQEIWKYCIKEACFTKSELTISIAGPFKVYLTNIKICLESTNKICAEFEVWFQDPLMGPYKVYVLPYTCYNV